MSDLSVERFFSQDHDRLDELFGRFQRLGRSCAREAAECFGQFKSGLERHILWEEGILFPFLEEKMELSPDAGPTRVMRMEHQQIKEHLEAIRAGLEQGADRGPDEEALQELLRAHNNKEESILYPMIDHHLTEEERKPLFARIEQMAGNRR